MADNKRFKLTDRSLNNHGFRVVTGGIDLTRFNTNPVMLHLHNQALLLGKWTNLKLEDDGSITAEPEFNEGNDYALARKQEVEAGYLNGASVGLTPKRFALYKDVKADLKLSDDTGFGDDDLMLMECSLDECTLCAVPSNGSALQLYHNNGKPMGDDDYKQIKLSFQTTSNKTSFMDKKALCLMLGIPETSTDAEITIALQNQKNAATTNNDELKKLRDQQEVTRKANIKLKLDEAEGQKKFLPTQRALYENLMEKDYDATVALLNNITGVVNLAGANGNGNGAGNGTQMPAGRESWDFTKWMKEDEKGLNLMQTNDPEKFKALYLQSFSTMTAPGKASKFSQTDGVPKV